MEQQESRSLQARKMCIRDRDKEASEDDTRAAEVFLDYVESDAAIKVFEDYGFTAYEAEDSEDATEASADNTEAEDSTASADSTSK